LTLASRIEGREVLTIEGLSGKGEGDALVQSFAEFGAMQCGYCTPGFILAAKGLLLAKKNPSVREIKHYLSGNICRCGSYEKIIKAVIRASRQQRGGL